jgi:hypothetical protein
MAHTWHIYIVIIYSFHAYIYGMYLAGNYTHTHNMLHTTHIGRRASLSGLSNLYSSHSDMDAILTYLNLEQNKKKRKIFLHPCNKAWTI